MTRSVSVITLLRAVLVKSFPYTPRAGFSKRFPLHTHTHTHTETHTHTQQIMIVYYDDHELDSNNFSDILVKIYRQQMIIMVMRTGDEETSTEGVC